jgi:Tol biopolymer transport system component
VGLFRWDLAGQPRKVIGGITHLTGYALSPDQRMAAIGGDIKGTLGVWLVDLATGKARQVGGTNVECVDPAFTISGTKVVCSWQKSENDGELWMINTSGDAQ